MPTTANTTPRLSASRKRSYALVTMALSVAVGLLIAELALRQVMGNMATDAIVQPDDELCYAPIPGSSLTYTGWLRRIPGTPIGFNERGYRGPVLAAAPPAGVTRIVALGDSLTYGVGVHHDDTFAARIGGDLGVEVINRAVPGYNVEQSVAWYARNAANERAQRVVFFYYDNDTDPTWCERAGFRSHGPAWLRRVSYLWRMWALRGFRYAATAAEINGAVTRNIAAFTRLAALTKAHGACLNVVFLWIRDDRLHRRYTDALTKLGVESLRLPSVPRDDGGRLHTPAEWHYNIAGHERAHKAIGPWLARARCRILGRP